MGLSRTFIQCGVFGVVKCYSVGNHTSTDLQQRQESRLIWLNKMFPWSIISSHGMPQSIFLLFENPVDK